jgi:hypothetical protein
VLVVQSTAEVVVGQGQFRVELNRLAVLGDGLIQLILLP